METGTAAPQVEMSKEDMKKRYEDHIKHVMETQNIGYRKAKRAVDAHINRVMKKFNQQRNEKLNG